jgi:hypothetical protein
MIEVELKNLNNSWKIVGINFFILGLIFLILSYLADTNEWYLHGIFCGLSSLIFINHFRKLIYIPKETLFIDLRWIFLFSFWSYFVFGSSLLVFGSDELINKTKDIYIVNIDTALRINSINAIGLSIVLLVTSTINISWPMTIINGLKKEINHFDPLGHRSLIVATCFCFISFITIFLGYSGYIERNFMFGIFQIFQHAGIGFALIFFYYKGRYRTFIFFVITLYLCLYITSGFYFFNRSLIVAPIAFFTVLFCIKKNSFKLLTVLLIGYFFLFQILGSYTVFKRSYTEDFKYSSIINPTESKYNFSLWDRLNYMSSQAAAIDYYNKGDGGDSLNNIFCLFVPRFLNKNKPDVSSYSGKFSKKFRKHGGTRDSPGVFIEGYYNYGWAGLIFVSSLVGLIVKIYSILIKTIIFNKIYACYFLIFSGIWTCFRIDGLFITDYLGQIILFLYFIILLTFILKILRFLIIPKKL